jgi:hypothetical protein
MLDSRHAIPPNTISHLCCFIEVILLSQTFVSSTIPTELGKLSNLRKKHMSCVFCVVVFAVANTISCRIPCTLTKQFEWDDSNRAKLLPCHGRNLFRLQQTDGDGSLGIGTAFHSPCVSLILVFVVHTMVAKLTLSCCF